MSTFTITVCDINGCDQDAKHKQKPFGAVFTTEQTEGRSAPPHFSGVLLDLCEEHWAKLLQLSPLRATGAQGNNTYKIEERKSE
jgi:hypothetical protein